MNKTTRMVAAIGIAACCSLALAEDRHDMHEHHAQTADPIAWEKNHLEHEKQMLAIRPVQQGVWESYTAARLELLGAAGAEPDPTDAAAVSRRRAERAAATAQKLAKVADATEKLQAVLADDQRKVLAHIASHHGTGEPGMPGGAMCGMDEHRHDMKKGAGKPAKKLPQ